MKERPILFSAPMVRAILDGSKTQTRRVVNPQFDADAMPIEMPATDPVGGWVVQGHSGVWWCDEATNPDDVRRCPYGQPGDRLWVRETWGVVSHAIDENGDMVDWLPDRPANRLCQLPFGNGYYSGHAIYRADGEFPWAGEDGDEEGKSLWKPSIHMPRWASRIQLEITNVRVERLQDISVEDAEEEGCKADYELVRQLGCAASPSLFKELWTSINGENSWDANPWVWVIEFRRINP